MTDVLWQGLTISLIGISLTFLALGLLVLVMVLLERFTRQRVKPSVSEGMAPEDEMVTRDGVDEEIVAVITAALTHLRTKTIYPADLGATLEAGPGAWWTMGRSQVQSVNIPRTVRWRC